MSRNGAGVYSVVNTFVAGNTITAAGHNTNWTDIGAEITNSVAVDGQSTMTGPLKAADGSVGAPAWTFGSDLDTGGYRIGANNFGFAAAGAKVLDISTTGLGVVGTVLNGNGTVSLPAYSFTSDPDSGWYRIGANNIGTAVNGAKVLDVATTGLGVTGLIEQTSTSHFLIAAGTTAQRPSNVAGRMRYNSTGAVVEFADGTNWIGFGNPRSYLAGLTLSNGTDATNDINIAVGTCRNAANDGDITLASILTKQLDAAWSVGTNAGGLDTGSIANTTYHIWLIRRSDTGVVDALFSTSASSPTMPSSYDSKRRIGSIVRAGATLLAFTQNGDDFHLTTPVLDISNATPGTSANTGTLASVPAGVKMFANITSYNNQGGGQVYISALDQTDQAPSTTASPLFNVGDGTAGASSRTLSVWTNTSAQVRYRAASNTQMYIQTNGWFDRRGRDD